MDPAVLTFFGCGDRIGVVPDIQAVDIFRIEPEADVMRMIDGFAGAGLERETTGDQLAIGCIDGI